MKVPKKCFGLRASVEAIERLQARSALSALSLARRLGLALSEALGCPESQIGTNRKKSEQIGTNRGIPENKERKSEQIGVTPFCRPQLGDSDWFDTFLTRSFGTSVAGRQDCNTKSEEQQRCCMTKGAAEGSSACGSYCRASLFCASITCGGARAQRCTTVGDGYASARVTMQPNSLTFFSLIHGPELPDFNCSHRCLFIFSGIFIFSITIFLCKFVVCRFETSLLQFPLPFYIPRNLI